MRCAVTLRSQREGAYLPWERRLLGVGGGEFIGSDVWKMSMSSQDRWGRVGWTVLGEVRGLKGLAHLGPGKWLALTGACTAFSSVEAMRDQVCLCFGSVFSFKGYGSGVPGFQDLTADLSWS